MGFGFPSFGTMRTGLPHTLDFPILVMDEVRDERDDSLNGDA